MGLGAPGAGYLRGRQPGRDRLHPPRRGRHRYLPAVGPAVAAGQPAHRPRPRARHRPAPAGPRQDRRASRGGPGEFPGPRAGPGGCGACDRDHRGRRRRVDRRPSLRPAQARRHRGAGGTGRSAARSDAARRGALPVGAAEQPRIGDGADRGRPDTWPEPVLRLHPPGAFRLGCRRRRFCRRDAALGDAGAARRPVHSSRQ